MVDARAFPFHFIVGNIREASQKVAGSLHGMAEPDNGEGAGPPGGQAQHIHRVRVVEHDRLRAQPLGVLQNLQKNRRGAERFEKPARPDRVPDALVHAIFQGDVVVELHAFEPADLDAIHDVMAPGEDIPTVRGGMNLPVCLSELGEQLADDPGHRGQPGAVDIHQRDGPAAFAGSLQDVVDQPRGEPTARAEQGDFQRPGKFPREGRGGCVFGMCRVPAGFGFLAHAGEFWSRPFGSTRDYS